MGNPLTSEQFIRLLDKRLRDVSENKIKEIPTQREQFYKVVPSDSAWDEFFSVGALPDIPAFNGKLTYLSQSPGYLTRIEPKEYAGAVASERKLLDDKKYSVLDNRAAALSESLVRTQEKSGVETFAYAFSSAFTYMYSEEGLSLCNDSHTTKSGVSTSTGFDNAGTSALDKTSLAAARLAMRRFKGDIGQRINIDPDMLIVPDNLYDAAMEIVGSDKDPESANNTMNPQYKRFKVVSYMRLDDYDTNNWFLVDSRLMKESLLWIDRIKAEFNTNVDFDTFQVSNSIYARWACGFIDWRWVWGSSVS